MPVMQVWGMAMSMFFRRVHMPVGMGVVFRHNFPWVGVPVMAIGVRMPVFMFKQWVLMQVSMVFSE